VVGNERVVGSNSVAGQHGWMGIGALSEYRMGSTQLEHNGRVDEQEEARGVQLRADTAISGKGC